MVIFTVITSVAFLFMLVRNINSSIEMKAYKKGEHGEVLYVMEETRTGMKVLRIVCLLLIHAEDQMMSCEVFKQMAVEFIELYEKLG